MAHLKKALRRLVFVVLSALSFMGADMSRAHADASSATSPGPRAVPLLSPTESVASGPAYPAHLTPYFIAAKPHLIGTLSLYGVLALAEGTVKPLMAGHLNCRLDLDGARCDAARLWGPDKSVVGQHSPVWRRVSDLGNIVGLGGAVVAAVVDSYVSTSAAPLADAATDVLVMAETVGVATLVTHTLKYAIRRPRPGMYAAGRYGVESELSFPSGHTTAAAAGCAAYATTFALRHPHGPARYGVWLAGAGITALTAYGRVAGGMHFYTDVLAGAFVGGAIGYLLPSYYARGVRIDVRLGAPGQATSSSYDSQLGVALSLPLR